MIHSSEYLRNMIIQGYFTPENAPCKRLFNIQRFDINLRGQPFSLRIHKKHKGQISVLATNLKNRRPEDIPIISGPGVPKGLEHREAHRVAALCDLRPIAELAEPPELVHAGELGAGDVVDGERRGLVRVVAGRVERPARARADVLGRRAHVAVLANHRRVHPVALGPGRFEDLCLSVKKIVFSERQEEGGRGKIWGEKISEDNLHPSESGEYPRGA